MKERKFERMWGFINIGEHKLRNAGEQVCVLSNAIYFSLDVSTLYCARVQTRRITMRLMKKKTIVCCLILWTVCAEKTDGVVYKLELNQQNDVCGINGK